MMGPMKESTVHKIRGSNFRVSKNLKEILDALSRADGPLTIQEIGDVLAVRKILPNKTTLYRQMEKLKQLDLIQESLFSDSVKRYCAVSDKHHHHFYCMECGYAEELPDISCDVIPEMEKLFESKQFKVINHHLEIEGLCSKCNI